MQSPPVMKMQTVSRSPWLLFVEFQISDEGEVEKMVREVLDANPKQVEQYRGGKTKLQGFFTGQVQDHL